MTKNTLMLALASGAAASIASGQTVLFTEDFEDRPLGPFVSPSESGGDGTDWTDELPDGWLRDNMDTPTHGPVQFFGFTFPDKDSWIATAGDQARSEWTRGEGTIMTADPDEYDDIGDIDPDLYRVLVQTPAIDLSPVTTGLVEITFDSTFRPEDLQEAQFRVSFDGGASFDTLLTYNSDTVSGLERINENVFFNLDIPAGASDLILEFAMPIAGNDWWWGIDNIVVREGTSGPEPFSFVTTARTVFEETTPLIEWTEAAAADTYSIVVSENEDLSDPVFEADGITGTSTEIGPVNSDRYYVSVTAVNPDGERVIDSGPLLIFVVNPCNADVDGDGSLTIFDFLAFQNDFDRGCP